MSSNKSLGPIGFTAEFFKAAWSIVGGDVTRAVHELFKSGKLLRQYNASTITLVPKCQKPKKVSDYRPISCCNILYKCISKLLAERLKKSLPSLISRNQSAFVEG